MSESGILKFGINKLDFKLLAYFALSSKVAQNIHSNFHFCQNLNLYPNANSNISHF